MGAFEFLPNLLSTMPGTVVYHLLVFLSFLAAAGIVWTEWRHEPAQELKPYLIALIGAMVLHLMAAFIAPLHQNSISRLAIWTAPLLYAADMLSVLLLVWAFASRWWGGHSQGVLSMILGGWLVLWLGTTLLWAPRAIHMQLTYTMHSWQVPMWYALTIIVAATGAISQWLDERKAPLAAWAFALLGAGALLGLIGAPIISEKFASGEGWGRLFALIGYSLFTISLYSRALQDLNTYRQELVQLGNESLRQSQELLFLVEATRSIGETLDLRGMLDQVVDNMAMALRADVMAILLLNEDSGHTMHLAALYKVLGRVDRKPREIKLHDYPALEQAMEPRQIVLTGEESDPSLKPLLELLQVNHSGPLLIQPLTRQDRTVGVFVAYNDRPTATFSPEQQKLAASIAVQIAGAVENRRLYNALQAKAQELSDLLAVRVRELRREEAILESMSEGILVLSDEKTIILLNRAAEELLGVKREQLKGRSLQELQQKQALRDKLPFDLLNGEIPDEATFELGERRIRIHASSVVTDDAQVIGKVIILQDITRESMAEEAKREFIASISHELRTPLTAIKGYTEVMLAGMAGKMPPAFTQFLNVIHENTTRMNSLTDNLISVSEIERGHIGLNYQTVDVQQIIGSVVKRYQERLHERELKLTLDYPDDLPEIEVDPNRLRHIIDNLLSNAIKFTYPKGEIRIGARSILGPMGKPTYLSLWISDTGVGIPIEEQSKIWERFYRADNPLSLEAGGLGIGLTITKALVEAHQGRVWVDSTVDHGSTFTVLLPIHPQRPDQEAGA